MVNDLESIWEVYTSSWKAKSADEKRTIFAKCLDVRCEYNDPNKITKSWDDFLDHMLGFHQQVPAGYFVTKQFMTHNNQSIARWDMKNGDHVVIGEGISYGRYKDSGKLISITGFFSA